MKVIRGLLFALCLASASHAQDSEPPQPDTPGLMEDFFSNLLRDMGPQIEEFERLMSEFGPAMMAFLAEMGPALEDILARVQDWTAYEPPEMLPNGDIIIRKKPPSPAEPAPGTEPKPDAEGIDI